MTWFKDNRDICPLYADLDYQGNFGSLLHNGGRSMSNTRDFLVSLKYSRVLWLKSAENDNSVQAGLPMAEISESLIRAKTVEKG